MRDANAATEALRIVAFINTRYVPDGDDALVGERSSEWLQEWLAPGVPVKTSPSDRGTREGLQRLRDLREALRQLAAANNDLQPDVDILARGAGALGSLPMLVELGDVQRGPSLITDGGAPPSEQAIATVSWSYLVARLGGDWPRVKACASPECRWGYLDASRNRSRRWCEMAGCGNRAKSRAWRERQTVRAEL